MAFTPRLPARPPTLHGRPDAPGPPRPVQVLSRGGRHPHVVHVAAAVEQAAVWGAVQPGVGRREAPAARAPSIRAQYRTATLLLLLLLLLPPLQLSAAAPLRQRHSDPPPPPHTHSHPFSARTPDRRQVEAARRRGRGQQQRGAVVPERVQRLDGLGALGQQHCSKGGGMMALVPAVGARGGRRSAAVPAVGTAPAAHPSPLPPCNRLRTALLAACP